MSSQQYALRKARKLRKELVELEKEFADYDVNDPDSEIFALEQKKQHLIRSMILDMHLRIEDLLTQLIICTVVLPDGVKRKFSIRKIKPELWELMEGERALGFSAKVSLARSLGVISPSVSSKLKKLNTIRNKVSHSWQLNIGSRRKFKHQKFKRPLLAYEGETLLNVKSFRRFMGEYTSVYLRFFLKISRYD